MGRGSRIPAGRPRSVARSRAARATGGRGRRGGHRRTAGRRVPLARAAASTAPLRSGRPGTPPHPRRRPRRSRGAPRGRGIRRRPRVRRARSYQHPPSLAEQKTEEERSADEPGDDADRQLGGREHGPRPDVGEDERHRAEEKARGDESRVRGAEDRPDRVRYDEADETDHAGERDRGASEQRGDREDRRGRALEIHTERRRGLLAQGERVETSRERDGRSGADDDDRRGDGELGAIEYRDSAEQPPEDRAAT